MNKDHVCESSSTRSKDGIEQRIAMKCDFDCCVRSFTSPLPAKPETSPGMPTPSVPSWSLTSAIIHLDRINKPASNAFGLYTRLHLDVGHCVGRLPDTLYSRIGLIMD